MLEFKVIQNMKPKAEKLELLKSFNKYPIINFAMAKIMEMTKEEQNQVALYIFNNIII